MEVEEDPNRIPVFDLNSPSPTLSGDVVQALHRHGFMFVRIRDPSFSPPPISPTAIGGMFSLARSFFHLPTAVKGQCAMQDNDRGWTSYGGEALNPQGHGGGDSKEAFNLGEFTSSGHAEQPLPSIFHPAEAEIAHFQNRCRALCLRILELIALGLEIEDQAGHDAKKWFALRHDPRQGGSGTILRLLHYPAVAPADGMSTGQHTRGTVPAATVRAGAHSDYGSLTLLFRQPGDIGLEIRPPPPPPPAEGIVRCLPAVTTAASRRTDDPTADDHDEWLPVPITPSGTDADPHPPILVNIGDLLSFWTGGWLRSTVHRVVGRPAAAAAERYSLAYFCHPIRDTRLVPVPSAVIRRHVEASGGSREGEDQAVLTAAEHLRERLRRTYGWAQGQAS